MMPRFYDPLFYLYRRTNVNSLAFIYGKRVLLQAYLMAEQSPSGHHIHHDVTVSGISPEDCLSYF